MFRYVFFILVSFSVSCFAASESNYNTPDRKTVAVNITPKKRKLSVSITQQDRTVDLTEVEGILRWEQDQYTKEVTTDPKTAHKNRLISMHERIIEKLDVNLLEDVKKARAAGMKIDTPDKQKIDHALSYQLIIVALEHGEPWVHANNEGQDTLEIWTPAEVVYNNISRTEHLTEDGYIILTFGHEPDKPSNHPFHLYHACLHQAPNKIFRDPAKATGFIDEDGKLKFKIERLKKSLARKELFALPKRAKLATR